MTRGRRQLIVFRSLMVEAGTNLRARRMQAMLSAFGIATGIAAVVILVALVSGVHRMALRSFNAAGGNLVQVTIEQDPSTRDPNGFPLTLQADDIDLVLASSGYFDAAFAESTASAVVRGRVVEGRTAVLDAVSGAVVLRTTSRPLRTNIRGVTAAGFDILNLTVAQGRLPLFSEQQDGARVVVLGANVAGEIFGQGSAVGEQLVLGDWTFRVIGVLQWVGEPTGEFRMPQDRSVYVPFRTNATAFRGNTNASSLQLRLREPGTNASAVADARAVISRRQTRHGESAGLIRFQTPLERLEEMNLIVNGLKLLVGMVGGIGLFVGAVGVANVLLVSVRERTQEIGVRRAVGATRRDVFVSFLVEAVAITMAGGLVGVGAAWLLTIVALFIPAIPDGAEPHISLVTALTAVTLLVVVGILAGVGPARRAAAVFPAEALRAE
jgi:putative ABC transport system permease protein